MRTPKRGEVWLVRFPFSDLATTKLRPALVLAIHGEDVIVIGIFSREHPPPHFHAVYGEYQITVGIRGGVVRGDFPKRALRLVLEWLDLHEEELLEDWNLVQAGRPANKIAPLE